MSSGPATSRIGESTDDLQGHLRQLGRGERGEARVVGGRHRRVHDRVHERLARLHRADAPAQLAADARLGAPVVHGHEDAGRRRQVAGHRVGRVPVGELALVRQVGREGGARQRQGRLLLGGVQGGQTRRRRVLAPGAPAPGEVHAGVGDHLRQVAADIRGCRHVDHGAGALEGMGEQLEQHRDRAGAADRVAARVDLLREAADVHRRGAPRGGTRERDQRRTEASGRRGTAGSRTPRRSG